MTAGKHSPSSAREIVENVVGRRIEERVGRIPSEPHGAGFVWVAGQRPNVGYRLIAAREDDVITPPSGLRRAWAGGASLPQYSTQL